MQAEIVFWKRKVGIFKCEVADVKTQVEINFLQTSTTLIVSNFSLRAAGQRGLIDVHETQPFRTKCRSSYIEVKLQGGFVLGQPFPTKCASTIKSCGETVILHMLAEFFAPKRVRHRK